MLKRTRYFLSLSLLWLASYSASAKESIAVVTTINSTEARDIVTAMTRVCQDRGFSINQFDMNGQPRRMNTVASDLADSISENRPKAILTIGDPATAIAQNAGTDIPVFFTMINYPEDKGFSGKGIAGISLNVSIENQINQIRSVLPIAKTIGVVYSQEHREFLSDIQQRAGNLGAKLVLMKVSSISDFSQAVESRKTTADALIFLPDTQVINRHTFEPIIALTLENKIPALVYSDYLVGEGFLMSLSPNYLDVGRQAGNRICGTSTLTEKIEAPESARLSINRNTAKQIGINISEAVLTNATIHGE